MNMAEAIMLPITKDVAVQMPMRCVLAIPQVKDFFRFEHALDNRGAYQIIGMFLLPRQIYSTHIIGFGANAMPYYNAAIFLE
jgi:hypothetical protein